MRRKDERVKHRQDPLTQISTLLTSKPTRATAKPHPPPSDATSSRLAREQSERQRALALIAQSRAPALTPSTVGRTWEEDFERQKSRAGMRYSDHYQSSARDRVETWRDGGRAWDGARVSGRSWEV